MIWTYIKSVVHPTRRHIILCLDGNKFTFIELLKHVPISSNHGKLGYHLRKLIANKIVGHDTSKKYHLTERGGNMCKIIRDINQFNIS